MKYLVCFLMAAAFVAPAFAETDYIALPEIRRVEREYKAADTTLTAAIAAKVSVAAAAQVTTNAAISPTLYVPAHAGQLLIFSASNAVYAAKGATTNDWLLLKAAE